MWLANHSTKRWSMILRSYLSRKLRIEVGLFQRDTVSWNKRDRDRMKWRKSFRFPEVLWGPKILQLSTWMCFILKKREGPSERQFRDEQVCHSYCRPKAYSLGRREERLLPPRFQRGGTIFFLSAESGHLPVPQGWGITKTCDWGLPSRAKELLLLPQWAREKGRTWSRGRLFSCFKI